MTTAFGVQVNADRLAKLLEHAPARMRDEMASVLLQGGIAHENVVKRNRFGPYAGRNGGDRLQRRTGALANAYQLQRPVAARLEMIAGIRSGVRGSQYAKVQEFGGTIRPKSANFLTVPLDAALTPAGALSARFKIRPKPGGGFTTDAGDTFLFRSKRGALLVGIKDKKTGAERTQGRGKGKGFKPYYVLKRSVTIKPRFGFFGSWQTIERGLIPKLLARAADRVVKEAGRA